MDSDSLKLVLQRHVRLTFIHRGEALPPGCYVNGNLDTGIDSYKACSAVQGQWIRSKDSAEPPEGLNVWIVPMPAWSAVFGTDAHEIDVIVPHGKPLEWPIGWLAHDLETANANWDEMSCGVLLDDSAVIPAEELQPEVLALGDMVRWRAAEVVNGDVTGVCAGPVLYMPALLVPRTVTVTFSFDRDVFDGWHMHRMGTQEVFIAHLLPQP